MKKLVKSLLSLMLVAVMTMGLATTVLAAPDDLPVDNTEYTITVTVKKEITNPGTFSAYQVFKGVYKNFGAEEPPAEKVLANIQWGDDINGPLALAALKELNLNAEGVDPNRPFEKCEDAEDVANVLNSVAGEDNPELAQLFADTIAPFLIRKPTLESGRVIPTAEVKDGKAEIKVKGAGYYLVESNEPTDKTNYVATRYILTVVGNVTVAEKADLPSVTKKVRDINDSEPNYNGNDEWKDTADYDIGDAVPFQLNGTLPDNYADYENYKYVFHDTLSSALKFDASSVKVYVKNGDDRKELTNPVGEGVAPYYTVAEDTNSFTVTFKDLMTIEAEGITINKDSEIIVEYEAKLTQDAIIGNPGNENKVYLEFSNNPNGEGEGTSTTPEDRVLVFTFKLNVKKQRFVSDKTYDDLPGAGFTLYKYNPGKEGDDKYEEVELSLVSDDANGKLYVVDPVNGTITEIQGDELTLFQFKGIDDGLYKLVESTVPTGYNKADDLYFRVEAVHTQDPDVLKVTNLTFTVTEGSEGEITVDGNFSTGSTNVVNYRGTRLPSTGGMGTTIFYIVGGILVVVAGVLLVTKKRMASQK